MRRPGWSRRRGGAGEGLGEGVREGSLKEGGERSVVWTNEVTRVEATERECERNQEGV